MNRDVPAATDGWIRTLAAGGIMPGAISQFGPCGLTAQLRTKADERGSLVITEAEYPDDPDTPWLHASLAFEHRTPSYAELALVHRAVFGRRRYAYQVFAPQAAHVNIHEHALHLWGRVDGQPAIPGIAELVEQAGSI
jgi:hypothetical protein